MEECLVIAEFLIISNGNAIYLEYMEYSAASSFVLDDDPVSKPLINLMA